MDIGKELGSAGRKAVENVAAQLILLLLFAVFAAIKSVIPHMTIQELLKGYWQWIPALLILLWILVSWIIRRKRPDSAVKGQVNIPGLIVKNGDFISAVEDPRVYLVKNGTRHWIATDTVLTLLGQPRASVPSYPESIVFSIQEGTKVDKSNLQDFR